MNVFLGDYGIWGTISLEAGYIDYYQGKLAERNGLLNGGPKYTVNLMLWRGPATVSSGNRRSDNQVFVLVRSQILIQYLFLNNSNKYQIKYWVQDSGNLEAKVEKLLQISGNRESIYSSTTHPFSSSKQGVLDFNTSGEYEDKMKTVKVIFTNTSIAVIALEDIEIQKRGRGGQLFYCTASVGNTAHYHYITSLTARGADCDINYNNNAYPGNGYGIYGLDSIVASQRLSFTQIN
jgi:hypothetical protein